MNWANITWVLHTAQTVNGPSDSRQCHAPVQLVHPHFFVRPFNLPRPCRWKITAGGEERTKSSRRRRTLIFRIKWWYSHPRLKWHWEKWQPSWGDSFFFCKWVYLRTKMTGYSDTPLKVTVFAVPKGVTMSREPCTRLNKCILLQLRNISLRHSPNLWGTRKCRITERQQSCSSTSMKTVWFTTAPIVVRWSWGVSQSCSAV